MILPPILPELLIKLLADMGVDSAARIILRNAATEGGTALNQPHGRIVENLSQPLQPEESDGETSQFLVRQRLRLRVALARTRWAWLITAAYFHPIQGRSAAVPREWDPELIAGEFTTTDFVESELPHERDLGEGAQSDLRLKVIQCWIQVAIHLKTTTQLVEEQLLRLADKLSVPSQPWSVGKARVAWLALMTDLERRSFQGLPQLNSFCGFAGLWSVGDTPAAGIVALKGSPSLSAYASVAELAWHLCQKRQPFHDEYLSALTKARPPQHQYALRVVAKQVLKDIWKEHSSALHSGKSWKHFPKSGVIGRAVIHTKHG